MPGAMPGTLPGADSAPFNQNPAISDEAFYRAAIGPENAHYYLRHFAAFDAKGKAGITWHWPAFFVTFYWLLYRKMWLQALLYFFLPYILLIPLAVFAAVVRSETGVGLAYLIWLGVIIFGPPLYANALYYWHCRKMIAKARASSPHTQYQLGELASQGGTSNVIMVVVGVFFAIMVMGILAAIAIPAYQDYLSRARTTAAHELGLEATRAVGAYYVTFNVVPVNLAAAGFTAQTSPSIISISLDWQTGVITLVLAEPLEGKSMRFIPSLNEQKRIYWICTSDDIPARVLPAGCRP